MSIIKDLWDVYKEYTYVQVLDPYGNIHEGTDRAVKMQKKLKRKFLFAFLPISWIVLIVTLWIITSFATKLI